jgi:hypothetical protein
VGFRIILPPLRASANIESGQAGPTQFVGINFLDDDSARSRHRALSSTAFQIAVRAVARLSAFAVRYPIGWSDFTKRGYHQ